MNKLVPSLPELVSFFIRCIILVMQVHVKFMLMVLYSCNIDTLSCTTHIWGKEVVVRH